MLTEPKIKIWQLFIGCKQFRNQITHISKWKLFTYKILPMLYRHCQNIHLISDISMCPQNALEFELCSNGQISDAQISQILKLKYLGLYFGPLKKTSVYSIFSLFYLLTTCRKLLVPNAVYLQRLKQGRCNLCKATELVGWYSQYLYH